MQVCQTYVFRGKVTSDPVIQRLRTIAQAQKSNFLDIYPWNIQMAQDVI